MNLPILWSLKGGYIGNPISDFHPYRYDYAVYLDRCEALYLIIALNTSILRRNHTFYGETLYDTYIYEFNTSNSI